MLEFIIIVSALVLIAGLFFAPTLFKTNRLAADNYDQRNTQIAREQLNELKKGLQAGAMSQLDFDEAQAELQANLAIDLSIADQSDEIFENSDKASAVVLIVLVPLLAVFVYMQLGRPDAIDIDVASLSQHQAASAEPNKGEAKLSMQEAASKLRERLASQPDDPQGWFMLARTYMVMEQYPQAAEAYENTIKRVDADADLYVRYADALAMGNQGILQGKPLQIIEKALSLDPMHVQGLWMAGMAANEVKDYKRALRHFLILQPMLRDNAENLAQLHGVIGRTEQNLTEDEIKAVQQEYTQSLSEMAKLNPALESNTESNTEMSHPATADTETTGEQVNASIQVSVTLDESLRSKVSHNDVVFIYAKAMSGPPMPLAAAKQIVADLPITVTLNDAMAMMPTMKLSGFEQVKIGAKISKSGRAGSAAGDLFGEVENISVSKTGEVSVLINKVR